MKNTFKLFGIIALLAVIGFSMAACGGNDNGEVKLAGTTWKAEVESNGITSISTLKFTTASEFQFTMSVPSLGFETTGKGTYTFDGKSGTLTFDDGSLLFEVNGNKLTTKLPDGENGQIYTKQ